MQKSTALSLSPSFSYYSNGKIAEVAARTVDEFNSDKFSDDSYSENRKNSAVQRGEEDEFEFKVLGNDSELPSLTSADEIFLNGKIRPIYTRNFSLGRVKLQNEIVKESKVCDPVSPKIRLTLRKLFSDERDTTITTSSSSSSDADEIDSMAAVQYCLWPPEEAAVVEEESRCRKRSSAVLKRWKLRDFLQRSKSDGSEDDFVASKENEKKVTQTQADGGVTRPTDLIGGVKQISYLRYRQDLAGLFGDLNSLKNKLESF